MTTHHHTNLYTNLTDSYDTKKDYSGITGERIADRLQQLSQIGPDPDGGVTRPGYSDNEKTAKRLVQTWMQEAGLEVYEDGAGNVIGRLSGKDNQSPAIASGSHVDTVPNGGNFDGTVGVLAAIEVAEAWKHTGYTPQKPYEIIVFSDEEGSRFSSGLTGSMAMTGDRDMANQKQLVDYDGKSFEEVLKAYGTSLHSFETAIKDLSKLNLFIEVHIEQGTQLEKEHLPVGIVSGIAGPARLDVTFTGEAGHAGSTPMIGRKDALVASGVFLENISHLPGKVSDTAVATVGQLNVHPNGANVIPEEVKMTVDIRDIHEESRDNLLNMIADEAKQIAKNHHIGCQVRETLKIKPTPIKQELQNQLSDIIEKHGFNTLYIPSGAGHDAMNMGRHTDACMLFVRSKNGISHHPDEWSTLNDIVTTIHVLKSFIEEKMKE